MSLKTRADFKAALMSAFDSLNKGIRDKALITEIEILSSKISSLSKAKQKIFANELCNYIGEADLLASNTWYGFDFLVRSLQIQNKELSLSVRKLLQNDECFSSKKNRFFAWNIFRISNKGLLPADIQAAKNHLMDSAPRLWLDLVISAHRNDAPEALTHEIKELVKGQSPELEWHQLMGLFTEIRLAYDNQDVFKYEIQQIANAILGKDNKIDFLSAVDARLGTSYSTSRKFLDGITTEFGIQRIASRIVQVEKKWKNFDIDKLEAAA